MATTSGVVLPVNQAYAIRGASGWRRYLKLPQSQTAHLHRFRDTFAVELLLAGVPLERSLFCSTQQREGHGETLRPWVLDRQQQLEEDVRRTWTKGTPEVRGGKALV